MSVQPLAPLSSSILMSLICYYLPPKGTNADDKGEVENASNGSDSGEFEVCPYAYVDGSMCCKEISTPATQQQTERCSVQDPAHASISYATHRKVTEFPMNGPIFIVQCSFSVQMSVISEFTTCRKAGISATQQPTDRFHPFNFPFLPTV